MLTSPVSGGHDDLFDDLFDDLLDGAVRRLDAEFGGRIGRTTLCAVARRCRADLSGVPDGALPELVERLARQRLLDLVA